MAYLSQIVVEEVPVSAYRKKIMKRLEDITKMVSAVAPGKHVGDEAVLTDKSETIKENM